VDEATQEFVPQHEFVAEVTGLLHDAQVRADSLQVELEQKEVCCACCAVFCGCRFAPPRIGSPTPRLFPLCA
jgi:hypothetical protein